MIISPHSQHLCSLGCIPTTCGPAGLSLRVCHSVAITHISDGLKMDLEPYVLGLKMSQELFRKENAAGGARAEKDQGDIHRVG